MNQLDRIESLINAPWTPFLFGFLGWYGMWSLQLQFTSLNYALGVSLVFLPAGIRTLSVLIFGFRGALGVFFGSVLSTIDYMGHIATIDFFNIITIAAISAFSSYLMMISVCWWRKIGANLDELTFTDVLAIVFSQGLLSSALHQIMFAHHLIDSTYNNPSYAEAFRLWAAMATGDIVGSMILMLGAVAVLNLFNRVRHYTP